MKTVKRGTRPPENYEGRWYCPSCATVVDIYPDDLADVLATQEPTKNAPASVQIMCPVCAKERWLFDYASSPGFDPAIGKYERPNAPLPIPNGGNQR